MWVPEPDAATLPLLLVAGAFLGSPHCIAMCGPLRLLAPQSPSARLGYQLGRGVSYAILGGVAGLLGWSLPPIAVVALVPLALGMAFIGVRLPSEWSRFRGRALSLASAHPLPMGVASGLLPCGMLHGWLALAAMSQTPLRGASVLFALWLGTLPALEAGSWAVAKPLAKLRRLYPKTSYLLVLLVAMLPILWREHLAFGSSMPQYCHGGAVSGKPGSAK